MRHLAAFAFLLGVFNVATGAENSLRLFSSMRDEEEESNLFSADEAPELTNAKRKYVPHFPNDEGEDASESLEELSRVLFPNALSLADFSSLVCTTEGPPVLEYFAVNFIRLIKASNKLKDAFLLVRLTDISAGALYYDIIFKSHSSIGSPDAQISAITVSQAVRVNFVKVKTDSLINIYAYTAAKFLFYRGVLNANNVEALYLKYFDFVKRSIESVLNPTPERNIRAVHAGFVSYFTSLELFNQFTTTMISGQFANEFYLLPK